MEEFARHQFWANHKVTHIGQGSHGSVVLVHKSDTNEQHFCSEVLMNANNESCHCGMGLTKPTPNEEDYVIKTMSRINDSSYAFGADCYDFKSRVLREVIITSCFPNSPFIVRCTGTSFSRKNAYVHMKYEGVSLNSMLVTHQSVSDLLMPLDRIHLIASQLIRATRYLHSFGVSHRDIKPDNILVNADFSKISLADFGCAKSEGVIIDRNSIISFALSQREAQNGGSVTGNSVPQSLSIVTPGFRAPELILTEEVDSRSLAVSGIYLNAFAVDMFSIGMTLLACILGVQYPCGTDRLNCNGDDTFLHKLHKLIPFKCPSDPNNLSTMEASMRLIFPDIYYSDAANKPLTLDCLVFARYCKYDAFEVDKDAVRSKCESLLLLCDLVSSLLCWNPSLRPSAEQALQHPFFDYFPRANDGMNFEARYVDKRVVSDRITSICQQTNLSADGKISLAFTTRRDLMLRVWLDPLPCRTHYAFMENAHASNCSSAHQSYNPIWTGILSLYDVDFITSIVDVRDDNSTQSRLNWLAEASNYLFTFISAVEHELTGGRPQAYTTLVCLEPLPAIHALSVRLLVTLATVKSLDLLRWRCLFVSDCELTYFIACTCWILASKFLYVDDDSCLFFFNSLVQYGCSKFGYDVGRECYFHMTFGLDETEWSLRIAAAELSILRALDHIVPL